MKGKLSNFKVRNPGWLYVCYIYFWEVAMKAATGKLVFSLDPAIWRSG
jgi:hypothetical protein